MIGIQGGLFPDADRRAFSQHAQSEEGFEKPQLVLIDADGIERAYIQRAHFHILDPGAVQRLGGALARARDALGANITVVLVLDLQDIGIELLIDAVDLDAELFIRWVRRADGPR